MTLEDLYPAGTEMRDVHPDFRGMPLELWRRLKLDHSAAEHRKTLKPEDAPLSKQRLATPRDNYGWKSL